MRIKFASQKGSVLVEFGFILPLLVVITFGIIEFGMLIYNQQVITNASREGARAGIVAKSPRFPDMGISCPTIVGSVQPSIECVVKKYCEKYLVTFDPKNNNPPTIKSPVTGYSSTATFGTDLTVQVNYTYSFLVIPNFIPGINKIKNMQAVTVMRYE